MVVTDIWLGYMLYRITIHLGRFLAHLVLVPILIGGFGNWVHVPPTHQNFLKATEMIPSRIITSNCQLKFAVTKLLYSFMI